MKGCTVRLNFIIKRPAYTSSFSWCVCYRWFWPIEMEGVYMSPTWKIRRAETVHGDVMVQYHHRFGEDGRNVICSLYDDEKTVNVHFKNEEDIFDGFWLVPESFMDFLCDMCRIVSSLNCDCELNVSSFVWIRTSLLAMFERHSAYPYITGLFDRFWKKNSHSLCIGGCSKAKNRNIGEFSIFKAKKAAAFQFFHGTATTAGCDP